MKPKTNPDVCEYDFDELGCGRTINDSTIIHKCGRYCKACDVIPLCEDCIPKQKAQELNK